MKHFFLYRLILMSLVLCLGSNGLLHSVGGEALIVPPPYISQVDSVGAPSVREPSSQSESLSPASKNKPLLIASLVGASLLAVTFGVTCGLIKKESKKRMQQAAVHKKKMKHLKAELVALRAIVDALPFNDFREQADLKIAEVRALLEQDFVAKKDDILFFVEELRAEAVQLAADLESRRAHLEQVRLFMQNVRDASGNAFMEKVIALKTTVQETLDRLSAEEVTLSARLNQVVALVKTFEGRVGVNKLSLDRIELDLIGLNGRVSRAGDDVCSAQKTVERAVSDVTKTKRDMNGVYDDCVRLLSDLRTTARAVERTQSDASSEKRSLDQKIKDVHALLEKVRQQVSDIKRFADHEEARLKGNHAPVYYQGAHHPEPSAPF